MPGLHYRTVENEITNDQMIQTKLDSLKLLTDEFEKASQTMRAYLDPKSEMLGFLNRFDQDFQRSMQRLSEYIKSQPVGAHTTSSQLLITDLNISLLCLADLFKKRICEWVLQINKRDFKKNADWERFKNHQVEIKGHLGLIDQRLVNNLGMPYKLSFSQEKASMRFKDTPVVGTSSKAILGESVFNIGDAIKKGTLPNECIQVGIFRYQGQWICENNRGLAAAAHSGIRPIRLSIVFPTAEFIHYFEAKQKTSQPLDAIQLEGGDKPYPVIRLPAQWLEPTWRSVKPLSLIPPQATAQLMAEDLDFSIPALSGENLATENASYEPTQEPKALTEDLDFSIPALSGENLATENASHEPTQEPKALQEKSTGLSQGFFQKKGKESGSRAAQTCSA